MNEARSTTESALGPNSVETARCLDDLGQFYLRSKEFAKAAPLIERALEIFQGTVDPVDLDTAICLLNLAALHQELGDFAKAEPLFLQAVHIQEQKLGFRHPQTGKSLAKLGSLYGAVHDYKKAAEYITRAVGIFEEHLGPTNPLTVITRISLAFVWVATGDPEKAAQLVDLSLDGLDSLLRTNSLEAALAALQCGAVFELSARYAGTRDVARAQLGRAVHLCQFTRSVFERVYGPEHPWTVQLAALLAEMLFNSGEAAKADPLMRRALPILEKTFGADHQVTSGAREVSAWVAVALGKETEALEHSRRRRAAAESVIANIFSFSSERGRLAVQTDIPPYNLFGTLGHASDLALTCLHHKGAVLDSVLEDRQLARAAQNPADHALVDKLISAKRALGQMLVESPADLSIRAQQSRSEARARLREQVEQLEGELARRVTGLGRVRRAMQVSLAQVQAAISQQTVLIEYLRYDHYDATKVTLFEPRYGAVLLTSAGDPKWVPLGDAVPIEQLVTRYQSAVRVPTRAGPGYSAASQGQDLSNPGAGHELSTILSALHQQVWTSIERQLPPGTKAVIISPDGALNLLSFATLLGPDNEFLGQKYTVRYVTTGRDLLQSKEVPDEGQAVIFGNPDFSGKGLRAGSNGSAVTPDEAERGAYFKMKFDDLPGTARECTWLRQRARDWNWSPQIFTGADATESRLAMIDSPRILHVATHGFFLPDVDSPSAGLLDRSRGIAGVKPLSATGWLLAEPSRPPSDPLANPMHRSGLALAGARATLQAWKRGGVPPPDNDGIVTAEDVGLLRLDHTSLVVLSACDTGVGAITAGEGVLGLRRGFVQAGAKNLLMTLWSLDDQDTVQFMLDFYESAHRSGDPGRALAEVQRDWLVRLRRERGLARAVRVAGPFVLSSQGQP